MLNRKVARFEVNLVPGIQTITGLGFQPKLIIMQSVKTDIDWATAPFGRYEQLNSAHSFAAIDENLNSALIYHTQRNEDYVKGGTPASENIHSLMETTNAIHTTDTPPSNIDDCVAYVSSLQPDGFNLNVTTAPPAQYYAGYLALGGSAIEKTKVGTFLSIGPGVQAITGLGFKPDVILLFSQMLLSDNTTRDSFFSHCFGMGEDMNQFAYSSAGQKLSTVPLHQVSSGDAGYIFLGIDDIDSSSAPTKQATLVSMDSDGFTLNWATHSGPSVAIAYVALKGTFKKEVGTYDIFGPGDTNITTKFKSSALFLATPFLDALDHTTWTPEQSISGYGYQDTTRVAPSTTGNNYVASANQGTDLAHPTLTGKAARTNTGNKTVNVYVNFIAGLFQQNLNAGLTWSNSSTNWTDSLIKLTYALFIVGGHHYNGYLSLGDNSGSFGFLS